MNSGKIKIGDKIVITKSKDNWNPLMNRYVGKVVTVTGVYDKDIVTFEDYGTWEWNFEQGHFKLLEKIYELW